MKNDHSLFGLREDLWCQDIATSHLPWQRDIETAMCVYMQQQWGGVSDESSTKIDEIRFS